MNPPSPVNYDWSLQGPPKKQSEKVLDHPRWPSCDRRGWWEKWDRRACRFPAEVWGIRLQNTGRGEVMDEIAKLLGSHANIIYVNANDKKYIPWIDQHNYFIIQITGKSGLKTWLFLMSSWFVSDAWPCNKHVLMYDASLAPPCTHPDPWYTWARGDEVSTPEEPRLYFFEGPPFNKKGTLSFPNKLVGGVNPFETY